MSEGTPLNAAATKDQPLANEWKPISTAQKKAVNVILKVPKDGYLGYREVIGHWAEDVPGEEQPPFRGWFYDTGYDFTQIKPEPTHWRPLLAASAWVVLNGFIDPPPTPEGFTIEVQTDSRLGTVTAYRFIPIEGASPC
jgi:hypothetical protein